MVCPRARLSQCVGVGAPEEISLHIHLQNLEFALTDTLVNPRVRGVEAPRMPHHAYQSRFLLKCGDRFGVRPAVGKRNLDLNMFRRLEALSRLLRMQLAGRAENCRLYT